MNAQGTLQDETDSKTDDLGLPINEETDPKGEKIRIKVSNLKKINKGGDTNPQSEETTESTVQATSISSTDDPNKIQRLRRWPKFPAVIRGWDKFEEIISKWNVHQWSHFMCYLYRLHPVILRPERKKFIEIYYGTNEGRPSKLALDELRREHGGGGYKLMVIDDDTKTSVTEVKFEISMETDPKLNLEELDIGNHSNKAYVEYLRRIGTLDKDGNMTNVQQQKSDDTAGVLRAATEMMSKVSDMNRRGEDSSSTMKVLSDMMFKTLEHMRSSQPKQNELSQVMELVKFVSTANAPKGEDNSMMKMFMEQNMIMMKMLMDIKSAPPPPPPPHVSELDQFDKFLTLMEKLKGDDGPREHRKGTLEVALDGIAKIAEPIAQFAIMKMSGGGLAIPGEGIKEEGIVNETNANANGNARQQIAKRQVSAQPQQQEETGVEGNMNSLAFKQAQALISQQQVGQQIINAVYMSNGRDFAKELSAVLGTSTYAMMQREGVEGLMVLFKSIPAFWKVISQEGKEEERIRVFLADFVAGPIQAQAQPQAQTQAHTQVRPLSPLHRHVPMNPAKPTRPPGQTAPIDASLMTVDIEPVKESKQEGVTGADETRSV